MASAAPRAAPLDTPDQPWIGQRVAEQALHRHPGQRQHRAHGQAEQGPRQADLAEDHFRLGQARSIERQPGQAQRGAQGIAQRQADGTEGEGQPEDQHERNPQRTEQCAGTNNRFQWAASVLSGFAEG